MAEGEEDKLEVGKPSKIKGCGANKMGGGEVQGEDDEEVKHGKKKEEPEKTYREADYKEITITDSDDS